MTPDLVLGLDGGGSKTELVVADARGTVLAFERDIGLDPLADPAWETTLRQLLRRSAALLPSTRRCALALPAYGEADAVSARQADVVAQALAAEHVLLNDVHAAQIGAFAGGPGTLLLAGTGSMVWSVDPDGRSSRVGGWGDAFGDEGSGFWVGREALGLATRALDGRADAAAFASGLLERIGVGPDGLLAWCWSLPNRRAGIAALAAVVDAMAAAGDASAADLLARAADHLVAHVRAAAGRARSELPWSFAGGLFNCGIVSLRATAQLGPPQAPVLPPVGGAVLYAARAAGWDASPDWVAHLAEGLIGNVTRH